MPFVPAPDGTLNFGRITAQTGLPDGHIQLSSGTCDEMGNGYGLAHMEYKHGAQIRQNGMSVQEFVYNVAQNYTMIREGFSRGDSETYLLQLIDEYNNTLYIEYVERSWAQGGSFWNVNSGGVFRGNYGKNKDVLWNLPAVE